MNLSIRPLTWLTPSGDTYVSTKARGSGDTAIPDCPETIAHPSRFNTETLEWEHIYETSNPDTEVTIGEAEALWDEAQRGNVLASVLLKTLEL